MDQSPEDDLEVVVLYQPIVRAEARRLAADLRAFPAIAQALPKRTRTALEAAAKILDMIAGPELPQVRPGNRGVYPLPRPDTDSV